MFIKNRTGMETISYIILGLVAVAFAAIIFSGLLKTNQKTANTIEGALDKVPVMPEPKK